MDDLKSQLEAWANKTADEYHKLATDPAHPECNLAFYTQSDLTAIKNRPLNSIEGQPKLLILAINPADSDDTKYTYKGPDGQGQIQNTKIWHLDCGRMTGKQFLKGNPRYAERNEWHFWRRLRSILSKGKCENLLDDEKSVVYTNIIYFATKKADQIPAAAWQLQEYSIDLIKLLRPKHVLCLSIPLCFDKLPLDDGSKKILIPGKLAFGLMDKIPVYGIPHTSSRYTTAEMELVGACLNWSFKHDTTPESVTAEFIAREFADKIAACENRRTTPEQSHIDFEELKVRLAQRFGEPYEEKPKVVRYNFADNIQLTATTSDGGYFGIGANPMTKELPDKEKYRSLLNKHGWACRKSEVWYECKRFRSFDSIDRIIEELEQIQKEWIKL